MIFWYHDNKLSVAIIIGAMIIGVFIYLGMPTPSEQWQTNSLPQKPKANKVSASCLASSPVIVTKVIDGDTVIVEGGYSIRLLGIDADEKGYPCYNAAKLRLEELVLNKLVTLEKEITDTDQYDRCLRNIFLENKNIQKTLISEGLVVARFYEPDVRYRSEIAQAEKEALENYRGCKWKNN